MSRLLFDAFEAQEIEGSIDGMLAGSSAEVVGALEIQGALDGALAGSGLGAIGTLEIEGSIDGALAGTLAGAKVVVEAPLPPRQPRGTRGVVRRKL